MAVGVDLSLSGDRHRLIRWKRVNGKEAGRMARQPIDSDHPNPSVHNIQRALFELFKKIRLQRAYLAQCV